MNLSDQDLIVLLAFDLNKYFYLFMQTYRDLLYGYALYLLCNSQEAEDITQETFVNAYQSLLSFSLPRMESLKLKAWLFTIARNLVLNYKSRAGARQSKTISIDLLRERGQLDEITHEHYPSPEIEIEREESCEELHACIEQLPERYREPVFLHYIVGLTYPEIAAIFDQPPNTVKTNGRRGLNRLSELIKEQQQMKEEVK